MPPEDLHAVMVGQLYPPQQLIDDFSKTSDRDTAFVVTAACSASAIWAALSVVLPASRREDKEIINVNMIHGMTEMYKDENQTPLAVEELRSRIIHTMSRIWEAGTAHQTSAGRAYFACVLLEVLFIRPESGSILVHDKSLISASITLETSLQLRKIKIDQDVDFVGLFLNLASIFGRIEIASSHL